VATAGAAIAVDKVAVAAASFGHDQAMTVASWCGGPQASAVHRPQHWMVRWQWSTGGSGVRWGWAMVVDDVAVAVASSGRGRVAVAWEQRAVATREQRSKNNEVFESRSKKCEKVNGRFFNPTIFIG
jgi:hypothetical protein